MVITAALGGLAVSLLAGWHTKPFLCIPSIVTKPFISAFKVPPLIGMILLGCLARNCYGREVMAYSNAWAAMIREICLTLLLIRGGLAIKFEGKGVLVAIMTIIPQTFEALTVAIIASFLLNMPFSIAYTLGYTLCCISPSVIVPGLMPLIDKGYGMKKGIPTAIIAAGTFDDILTIVNNGICASIAFVKIDLITGEPKESIVYEVFIIFINILLGVCVGVTCGLCGMVFNTKLFKGKPITMYLKFIWCLICVFAFPFAADLDGYPHAKFVAALFFGYSSYRIWGEDKPSALLYKFWFYI